MIPVKQKKKKIQNCVAKSFHSTSGRDGRVVAESCQDRDTDNRTEVIITSFFFAFISVLLLLISLK